MERRKVLRSIGSVAVLGVAGCSSQFTSRPKLDLSVENYRDVAAELFIEVVARDASNRSDGVMYQEWVEVPANSVGDDQWRLDDFATARPCRIEVRVRNRERGAKTYHYHYVPDCTDDDAQFDPRVDLVLDPHSGLSFGQTTCSGTVASAP
ncbi:hypothetical protein L593_07975 [Salinarchaeum sp. Harcht-Bsk1]|nr:hypothetical protein L593_07975 [Salinarchaeum sp. Harcht-Bsk1]